MQRSRRRTGLGLALALLASIGPSSSEPVRLGDPVFSAIGRREGLSDSSVSCIAQDSQGFIWLGTRGGLLRYDGGSFKIFARESFDPGSLVDDSVRALHVDGKGIWVGTDGGLARLDLETERFVSYPKSSARPDSLSSDFVTSIARDGRGFLWVGTIAGLNRLDEAGGGFRRFLHDPADRSSLPSNRVTVLKTDREGRLWIGGFGMGLVGFDYERESFVGYRAGSPRGEGPAPGAADEVTAIDEDSSGRLWLGTASGDVSVFDPSSGSFEDRRIGAPRVSSICAAEEGVVYVGTMGGGLVEHSIASGRSRSYRAASAPGALVGDEVSSLFRDREGNLWIGTRGGGLGLLGGARRGCDAIVASEGGLPPGEVSALLVDRRGRLWTMSYGGVIARRDPATGAWRRYPGGKGSRGFPPDELRCFIREDGRGGIWAGSGGGLFRYDEEAAAFAPARLSASGSGDSPAAISAMADDPSGGAWLGTARGGLLYWDRASGNALRYRHEEGRDDSLSSDAVTALGRDSSGRLWIGTRGGIDRLEVVPGAGEGGGPRFVSYRYDPARPGGISSDSITAIFLDSRKLLWIGTGGGGLMRYEPETDSFVSFDDRNGLPDNIVQSLLEDASGDLWIAARSGLALYDRDAGRFRRISLGGGGSDELGSGACAAPDGSLLFGSVGRILRFDPSIFRFNDHRPPVVLASASIKGRPVLGAAVLAGLERLVLPRGQGSVSFEFAALDYDDPGRNLYSYRLEGFDADWSPPGGGRRAVYTNLPGGDYLFRVKASNGGGLWNEEGLALRLRVRRNPLASPLALVLYALLLAGGGYLAARSALGASLSSLGSEAEKLRAKLIAASAVIESAAIVDPLTGLPNRRKIEEHLELALSRAVQSKLDVAVLMVDIDHFKSYNDRFGKAAGDECLRSVARAISACVRRSSDVVARYGGEEFLVVMEKTSIVGALSEAETVRRAVEALGAVTASVGCVSAEPGAVSSPKALIADAEKALMAAKMLGRNRTAV